jgi:hypothetical protein
VSGEAVVALLLTAPSLLFTWAEAPGAMAEHYQVEMTVEGLPLTVFTTTQARVAIPLSLGRAAQLRVRGCRAGGCSAWSPPSLRVSLNLSADFDGDGMVQLSDYNTLVQQLGGRGFADLTGDGVVQLADQQELLEHLGSCVGEVIVDGQQAPAYVPCPPAS